MSQLAPPTPEYQPGPVPDWPDDGETVVVGLNASVVGGGAGKGLEVGGGVEGVVAGAAVAGAVVEGARVRLWEGIVLVGLRVVAVVVASVGLGVGATETPAVAPRVVLSNTACGIGAGKRV